MISSRIGLASAFKDPNNNVGNEYIDGYYISKTRPVCVNGIEFVMKVLHTTPWVVRVGRVVE